MNRADAIFIIIVIICTIGLYSSLNWLSALDADKQKIAIVEYKGKEVLRIDLNKDSTYQVDATKGIVYIEVKDEKIRVEKETSPYNYCSLQGWVSSSNVAIICLPNDLIITIHGVENGSEPDLTLH